MLKRTKWSAAAIVFIVIVELVSVFQMPFRWQDSNVIKYDVKEYYEYVPAVFIQHDLSFSFVNASYDSTREHYPLYDTRIGKNTGRMGLGMAILYTPLFAAGHIAAKTGGYKADGFSLPYQAALYFTGFLYSLIGFIFLRKLLRLYFSESVTAVTLICVGLGTNLFYYTVAEGAMPHATLFGLSCIFFYYTVLWHRSHLVKYIVPVAFTASLITLTRPTDILILLFFFLYGVTVETSAAGHLKFLSKHLKAYLLLFLILFFFAFIQMAYWKYATGQWIYYSYSGEHFFLNHPFIIRGLFSYRKGWLVYTPVMALALAGIIWMKKYDAKMLLPMIFYFGILIYVVFSWWCWWYGGSFGMRALIESYAFLAFPMAVFWSEVVKHGKTLAIALLYGAFFIFLNQFQTLQYERGILHWDSMSRQLYWKAFLKMDYVPNADKYYDVPDYDKAKEGKDR